MSGDHSPLLTKKAAVGSGEKKMYCEVKNDIMSIITLQFCIDFLSTVFRRTPCYLGLVLSTACFEEAKVTLLLWPVRFPDLSSIEHLRHIIDRRLSNLARSPQSLEIPNTSGI